MKDPNTRKNIKSWARSCATDERPTQKIDQISNGSNRNKLEKYGNFVSSFVNSNRCDVEPGKVNMSRYRPFGAAALTTVSSTPICGAIVRRNRLNKRVFIPSVSFYKRISHFLWSHTRRTHEAGFVRVASIDNAALGKSCSAVEQKKNPNLSDAKRAGLGTRLQPSFIIHIIIE